MDIAYAHDNAILSAREALGKDFAVLDTETTGLEGPEVCQIAVVYEEVPEYIDVDFEALVKPSKSIDASATAVHGITNEMVENVKRIDEYWRILKPLLETKHVYGYNVHYDLKALCTSLQPFGILPLIPANHVFDVMLCYAAFAGVVNPKYGTFKWYKLGEAMAQSGLQFEGEAHNALTDAYATLALLRYIADQKTTWELALRVADKHLIDDPEYAEAVVAVTYMRH